MNNNPGKPGFILIKTELVYIIIMKTIKPLQTKVNGIIRECEIYKSFNGNEYFIVNDEPVDMKVLYHCDTINGYVVIVEDDYEQRMVWECEEI